MTLGRVRGRTPPLGVVSHATVVGVEGLGTTLRVAAHATIAVGHLEVPWREGEWSEG